MQGTIDRAAIQAELRKAWEESGLSQQKIADALDITQGAVSQWMRGDRPVPVDKARALARLLNRRPEQIAAQYAELVQEFAAAMEPRMLDNETHVIVGSPTAPADMVYVPCVTGAKLSAGTGELFWEADEDVNAVAFRLDWMQSKGLRPERCKVWRVRGDSMEPRYSNGDSLLIDMSDRTPRHGKNFALLGDEGLRVKQLHATSTGGWEMFSLNPDKTRFPTEPIVHENYVIIGRVRGRSGDED